MNRLVKALAIPVGIFGACIGVTAVGGRLMLEQPVLEAVLLSGAMCFVHVVLGLVVLEWSYDRPPTVFLKRVLGGMAVRLLLMLAILAAVLVAAVVRTSALMLGLLGWYSLALVLEISQLQKKVVLRQQGP